MVISLIQDTVASFKLISDIIKGILELQTSVEVKAKVSELQDAVLSAQSNALAAQAQQTAMIEEIRNLKEDIARVKAWEKEKQRYKLISPWAGTVLYAVKEAASASEPPHWICTKCYEDGRKSILQAKKTAGAWFVLACPACKNEFRSPNRMEPPDPKYATE